MMMSDLEKMQARIFEQEGVITSLNMTISRLESMNEFLRRIIEKLIDNGKD